MNIGPMLEYEPRDHSEKDVEAQVKTQYLQI